MKKSRLISFLLSVALFVSCLPVSTAFAAPRTGSTAATAINATFNTPYNFNWTRDNNSDSDIWVKITLPSRGLLQFTGNKLIDVTGEDDYVYFNLFKSADVNTPIWKASNSKFKMQTTYNISLPLNAGTYYFAITDMWLSEGESRNLNCTFKHIPANNYEIEPNGNINLANPLTFETRVYGINSNDDDTYKITVTEDTPTRVKFGNLDLVDANASVKVTYPDGDSDYLTVGTYGAVKANGYYYQDVLLKKGVNTITVTTNYNNDCTYWIEPSKNISVGTPTITGVKIEDNDVVVNWSVVPGASGYEVWRKIGSEAWKNEGDFSSNGFEQWFTDFSKSYQFKIRAFVRFGGYDSNVKVYGGWSNVKSINPTPTNIKLSASQYTYNGKAQKPTVKIKDVNKKTLKLNRDYKVSYSKGRKKVGTYKVTITFKGDYTGKVVKTFKIVPKKTSISKVTAAKKSLKVKIKKQTSETSGYEIQCSTSKKFKSKKTVTINKNKTTSTTIKGLKAKKKYYVRVRTFKIIKGTKYYSAWSSSKNKKTK